MHHVGVVLFIYKIRFCDFLPSTYAPNRGPVLKRLLVTGASGFLGYNACRAAVAEGFDVFGAYLSRPVSIDKVTFARLDCTDPVAVRRTMESVRPDAVIHCAAMPDPNSCELNPEDSRRVNVHASINVANACRGSGASLVYTSTDLVFDGEHAPYRETDPLGPVNTYGRHKAEAEAGMRRAYPDVTVCRMPVMFGDPGPASKSFIQPLMKNLRQGATIKLFTDEIRTPVSGKTAARGLLLCLDKKGETFHLGGRRPISRYDFGLLLCRAIGAIPALVLAVSRTTSTAPASRARDVSLISDKAYALGYDPGPLEDQLQELECIKV
jgi:dTDP-4-dehydrorhamnose reductase